MRGPACVLAGLLLLFAATTSFAETEKDKVARYWMINSSVWIETVRPEGLIFKDYVLPKNVVGAGVVLGSYEVATAAHVVLGATKITVRNARGELVSGRIVAIDESVDLAILDIYGVFLDFATNRFSVGVYEGVGAVTVPRKGVPPEISLGIVETIHFTGHQPGAPLIRTNIKGEKGMSGGGLFDQEGNLVGIIVRVLDGPLPYLVALPSIELCVRLARCAGRH